MVHSMLFFWHRYELPAVALGLVSADRPRMGMPLSPTRSAALHAMTENQRSQVLSLHHDSRLRQTRTTGPVEVDRGPPIPSAVVVSSQPPPLVRQLSHGTTSSWNIGGSSDRGDNLSRPTSSTLLFRAGSESGGDDESYMFFMDGEVVMHRTDRSTIRQQCSMNHASDQNHDRHNNNNNSSSNHSNDNRNADNVASTTLLPSLQLPPNVVRSGEHALPAFSSGSVGNISQIHDDSFSVCEDGPGRMEHISDDVLEDVDVFVDNAASNESREHTDRDHDTTNRSYLVFRSNGTTIPRCTTVETNVPATPLSSNRAASHNR
jgi:hypothetical protein